MKSLQKFNHHQRNQETQISNMRIFRFFHQEKVILFIHAKNLTDIENNKIMMKQSNFTVDNHIDFILEDT